MQLRASCTPRLIATYQCFLIFGILQVKFLVHIPTTLNFPLLNTFFCLTLNQTFPFHIPPSLHLQSSNRLWLLFTDTNRSDSVRSDTLMAEPVCKGNTVQERLSTCGSTTYGQHINCAVRAVLHRAQCLVQQTGVTVNCTVQHIGQSVLKGNWG